jgi:predicted phage tail component-like protein
MLLEKGIESFAGVKPPAALIIEKVEFDALPSATITTKDIPMQDGTNFVDKRYNPRTVTATVTFKGTSKANVLEEANDELVRWLDYREPQPLKLRDLPNRTYMAVHEGSTPLERIESFARTTLTFTIHKVTGASDEPKTYALQPETTAIVNEGTADAFPIISFKLKKDTTYFFVTGSEQTIFFGQPHDPTETTVFDAEPIIFNDDSFDVTNWAQATNLSVDGGEVLGTITSNGYSFQQQNQDYGTLLNKWHGGSVVRSLGKEVQDFEANATIGFQLTQKEQKARIEVYMRDINDRIVGKMSLKDIDGAMTNPIFDCFMGQLGNGGVNLANTWGDYKGVWKKFNGIITLGRKGKTWYCYAGQIDQKDWSQDTRYYNSKYATIDLHKAKVAKIQLHIAIFSNAPAPPQNTVWINRVWVKEFKSKTASQVDYVGKAGDEFVINCETGEIFRNGQYIGVQYAGSQFIRFKRGANGITFSDPTIIEEGSLTFTERWL